jgi:glycerol-3-phosphate dehydrogenase (NAD(P)+)
MSVLSQNQSIAVLGAGSWGTAVASRLATAYPGQVTLWGRNAEHLAHMQLHQQHPKYLSGQSLSNQLIYQADLAQAVANAKYVLCMVPSSAFLGLLSKIVPLLDTQAVVVNGAKGLIHDPKNPFFHQRAHSILKEEQTFSLFSGPSFAAEVVQGKMTCMSIACQVDQVSGDLTTLFTKARFQCYPTNDLIGVQLCGAYKNVLAVVLGICDGLQLGINALSAIMVGGMHELVMLGQALGCQTSTFLGPAGLGDMVLTGTSNLSRNRRFGSALSSGLSVKQAQAEIGQVVEGVNHIQPLLALASSQQVKMPICEAVNQLFLGHLTAKDFIHQWFDQDRPV